MGGTWLEPVTPQLVEYKALAAELSRTKVERLGRRLAHDLSREPMSRDFANGASRTRTGDLLGAITPHRSLLAHIWLAQAV
jgi:hypothetical protein